MSDTQGQTPILSIKCSNCGRENATGRLFCQFCKHRLVVRTQAEPDLKGQPTLPVEAQQLQASLEAAQHENRDLHQQLESMKEELNKVKAASAKPEQSGDATRTQASLQATQDENKNLHQQLESLQEEFDKLKAERVQPAPEVVAGLHEKLKSAEDSASTWKLQSAGWQEKWKSAEEKAATFEKQIIAKAKEIEASFPQNSGANPRSNSRLKWIMAALVMVGGLGGYSAGHYIQPKDSSKEKANQLSAKVTDAEEQISNLKSLLDSANKKADQAANDSKLQSDSANGKISELTNALAAHNGQQRLMEGKLASTQTQLNTSIAQAAAADRRVQQLEATATAQAAAADRRVQQLEANMQSRDNEISLLRGRIASLQSQTPPRSGFIIWSGTVEKKHTVQIKDGKADFGIVISGALPGTQCIISNPDPAHVQLRTIPTRKNNWNQLSFEVSGMGTVRVQINWALAQ